MIVISSGLWIDQAPGAESVAGVCLLLRAGQGDWSNNGFHFCPRPTEMPAGYRVDLLATFEHPVDTREQDFQKAFRLALTDLPAPVHEIHGEYSWPYPSRDNPDWMLHPKVPESAACPWANLLSRARRWQGCWYPRRRGHLSQTELRWDATNSKPEVKGEGCSWSEAMARAQAASLAGP